jgi:hypothetical protein
MPERTQPPTWVTDGEHEWIGWLERVSEDGKAVVVDPLGGRVLAGWTPWESPPRVIAVLCADCDHPAAADDLVRGDDGLWLCCGCESDRAHAGARPAAAEPRAADARR